MDQTSELLLAYSRDPIGKYVMEDFAISMEQENTVCGDKLTVFLKICGGGEDTGSLVIEERSWDGYTEMQTTAAASMLAEVIQDTPLSEVLTWTYAYIKHLGLDLSPRRRRSGVTALLATRNAIHHWLSDGIVDTYEDLL